MQKYGGIIWQERLKNNMPADVLANILLLSEEELDAVETGKAELSDVRLNICANIFRISKEAMIQGVRKDALSDDEIRERLQDLNRKLSGMKPEKTFAEQIDEVIAGKYPRYDALKICDTPQILLDVGCEQLPILYTQGHLKKALEKKDEKKHRHGLSVDQVKNIYSKIEKPVMLYDSLTRDDSIMILTDEIDASNNPVMISICANGTGSYQAQIVSSNFATSIYGKNNIENHLQLVLEQQKVLFYDKNKSQELFSVLGLQFPEGFNNLDYNIIIRRSDHVVKNDISDEYDLSIAEETEKQPKMH